MLLKDHRGATIKYNDAVGSFEVLEGIVVPYRGDLRSCENFCEKHSIHIRNRDEVNRMKYSNMPQQEGF